MTEKAKTENYTAEMVATMREQYQAAENQEAREAVVESLAAEFGKGKRSIISKMSREGFYIKKDVKSKVTGEKPAKKEELADTLREVSELPLVGIEKANKTAIVELIAAFRGNSESEGEQESEA